MLNPVSTEAPNGAPPTPEQLGFGEERERSAGPAKRKLMTFQLGSQSYGIDIEFVTELIGVQRMTLVPDMPNYVRGVINLRGQVVPIMDVRLRFGMEYREHDHRTCVIVTQFENMDVGLLVDTVEEVLDVSSDKFAPPPDIHGAGRGFVAAIATIEGVSKIILDIRALLFDNRPDYATSSKSH